VAAAKRVKVAAAKREPQAHTLRERTSEQEALKHDSGTAIKQLACPGCQRVFGSAQGLASHLTDSYRCPSSSNYHPPTAEPAKRVFQGAEASTALHQISALPSAVTNDSDRLACECIRDSIPRVRRRRREKQGPRHSKKQKDHNLLSLLIRHLSGP
jgi:hypothetical protein